MSRALIVMVLIPSCSGTVALHDAVPLAVPEAPVLLLHETCATPPASLAEPLTFATFVTVYDGDALGDVIATDGGVVSAMA